MVSCKALLPLALTLVVAAVGGGTRVYALLGQTASDLAMLSDALGFELETRSGLRGHMVPILVAPPLHRWVESRGDFAASSISVLKEHFKEPSDLILCRDCDAWRLHVTDEQRTVINNGELSLGELARIRQDPRYGTAKSVATLRETPSGVELRVVSLTDGRILFYRLADATQNLDDVKPYLHYAQERDRRLREESLHYVFFNLGLWPKPLVQFEFVEQWGDRNQHISGVALSLVGPVFAFGGTYHYMFPGNRKWHVSGSLFYPLQNALADIAAASDQNATDRFVAQAMIQYTFANSYGVFASVGTGGDLSLGLSMYNPLFMPFLL